MKWYIIKNPQWKKSNNFPVITRGWGNGYVAVPPSHCLHGLDYDAVYYMFEDEAHQINIHGGLTYSNFGDGEKVPKDWWVFGFDTGHWNDSLEKWPKKAVIEETMSLFWQLLNIEWGGL